MRQEKEITIYDIAQHLNISAATVSRALKDNPAINKNTRKKINDAARELGYRSNTFASSLRSKKTHTLGVIVQKLNSHFISSVLAGMEVAANRNGYNLIITQSLENTAKEIANAEILYNKRVDGLLVSLAYNTSDIDHLAPFFRKNIPVVFFDRTFSHNDSTEVIIDNYRAAYEITKHMLDEGCKRILHISGNSLRNVYADRLRGFKHALHDAQMTFDEKLLYNCSLNEQSGIEAAEYILSLKKQERPDAVFAVNDTVAVHCMIRLKEAGICIPQDIAFAGFNNDPISKVAEPKLTTVSYPGELVGETAVTSLISHLNGTSNIKTTNTIILRSDIIIRPSSLKKNL
ncbi:MAG: hypothetical protein RLZZ316_2977 [Bacteroidota bacterium]